MFIKRPPKRQIVLQIGVLLFTYFFPKASQLPNSQNQCICCQFVFCSLRDACRSTALRGEGRWRREDTDPGPWPRILMTPLSSHLPIVVSMQLLQRLSLIVIGISLPRCTSLTASSMALRTTHGDARSGTVSRRTAGVSFSPQSSPGGFLGLSLSHEP